MSRQERRRAPRFITRLDARLRGADGTLLDPDAVAHEVSATGFRIQTGVALHKGQTLAFELELRGGKRACGRALVAWARREHSGVWAGLHIERMSQADRRRLHHELWPPTTDWPAIVEHAYTAAFWVVVALAGERLIARWEEWAGFAARVGPPLLFLAAVAAVYSLARERRR